MAFNPFPARGTRLKRIVSILRYLEERPRSSLNIVDYMYRDFGIKPDTTGLMVTEMAQARLIRSVGDKIVIAPNGKKMLEMHWVI